MKWTISINQRAAVEMGLDVDMVDLAVFDMLKDFTPCAACKKMQDGEKQYFSVPYKKVLSELPLLPIKTSDGIYRRFKKLEQAGILEMHPENAKMAMVWFAWGRNFQALSFDTTPGLKTEGTGKTPGSETVPPRMKNRTPPDGNPTYTIPIPIPSHSTTTGAEAESETLTLKDRIEIEKKESAAAAEKFAARRAFDPAAELEAMRTDEAARDLFAMNYRVPADQYLQYITDFGRHIAGTQTAHESAREFRSHFFMWSKRRYDGMKSAPATPGKSSLPSNLPVF